MKSKQNEQRKQNEQQFSGLGCLVLGFECLLSSIYSLVVLVSSDMSISLASVKDS